MRRTHPQGFTMMTILELPASPILCKVETEYFLHKKYSCYGLINSILIRTGKLSRQCLSCQLNRLRKQLIEHLLFGNSMISQLILFTLMSASARCIESKQEWLFRRGWYQFRASQIPSTFSSLRISFGSIINSFILLIEISQAGDQSYFKNIL